MVHMVAGAQHRNRKPCYCTSRSMSQNVGRWWFGRIETASHVIAVKYIIHTGSHRLRLDYNRIRAL